MTTKKDDKTIAITIRFWTNALPDKVGKEKNQIPFWTAGNVHLHQNKTKGVKSQNELFHYLNDIPRAIKEVMRKSKLAAVSDMAYTVRAEKRNKKRNQ